MESFIRQITISSARYHLIGYVPLMIAACITFAVGTQRKSAFMQFFHFACAAGALLMMMAGCWSSIFSAAGNYYRDYYEALSAIAQEQDADAVVFVNDSASAELARVFDPERVHVSYFGSNRSLVNYDAYDYYSDRCALSDRHLLVSSDMGGLSDLPAYLQSEYQKIGEVFGDTVYLAQACWLDGMAGPILNRSAVDYSYTQGYIFDTTMRERGVFPKGKERTILQSPSFPDYPESIRFTLHYRLDGSCAWLEMNLGDEAAQRIELPPEKKTITFDIPAGKAFSYAVVLGKDAGLYVDRITFDWL